MISMKPVAYIFSKGTITKLDTWKHRGHWKALFTAEQVAEARRLERERCVAICDRFGESMVHPNEYRAAIRALEDEK